MLYRGNMTKEERKEGIKKIFAWLCEIRRNSDGTDSFGCFPYRKICPYDVARDTGLPYDFVLPLLVFLEKRNELWLYGELSRCPVKDTRYSWINTRLEETPEIIKKSLDIIEEQIKRREISEAEAQAEDYFIGSPKLY